MRTKLQISFFSPVSGKELRDIFGLFESKFRKKIRFISIHMKDTEYKTVQITEYLTKTEKIFLKGIILGYFRKDDVYYSVVDKSGLVWGDPDRVGRF